MKSAIAAALGLYRVGSAMSHQFQFVSPPPSSNGISSPPAGLLGVPSPGPTPLSSVIRDSTGRRTAVSDRHQSSIESLISSGTTADEASSRSSSRVPSARSTLLVAVDKTKPPTMALPPPPKLPPPTSSMLPPAFIPERRTDGVPPPRPSSPSPPELIQQATTPLGSVLSVPGAKGVYNLRQHGSSMPPSQAGLRQPPSTSSFRSAANAANYAQGSIPPSNALPSYSVRERERREFSTTSLISEHSGIVSPRSSISSEHHHPYHHSPNMKEPPSTPDKTADLTPRAIVNGPSTDPVIIHAITQTMIGEFLYNIHIVRLEKVSEKKDINVSSGSILIPRLCIGVQLILGCRTCRSLARRVVCFFLLPWFYFPSFGLLVPTAYIEGVRSVLDPNPMPPGLYQYSVVISMPQREMKITTPTRERHDIWLNVRLFSFPFLQLLMFK